MRAIEVGLRFLVQQGVDMCSVFQQAQSMRSMMPFWTFLSLSRL